MRHVLRHVAHQAIILIEFKGKGSIIVLVCGQRELSTLLILSFRNPSEDPLSVAGLLWSTCM